MLVQENILEIIDIKSKYLKLNNCTKKWLLLNMNRMIIIKILYYIIIISLLYMNKLIIIKILYYIIINMNRMIIVGCCLQNLFNIARSILV